MHMCRQCDKGVADNIVSFLSVEYSMICIIMYFMWRDSQMFVNVICQFRVFN